MNIVQDNKGIMIDQINYAKKIVERFGQQTYLYTFTCIELQYISTEEQLADILTKSLPYERFKQLRNKIGLIVF